MCVYTYMGQLNIYIRDIDRVKLQRKARKMGFSLSKLMVTAALQFEEVAEEDNGNGRKQI